MQNEPTNNGWKTMGQSFWARKCKLVTALNNAKVDRYKSDQYGSFSISHCMHAWDLGNETKREVKRVV